MRSVGRLRELLHRRYLRAALAGLGMAAAAGGFSTAVLELRHEVPAAAVARYFTRIHDRTEDLAPLLREPGTLAGLTELGFATGGMNRGGLVYSAGGGLEFHPWMPSDSEASRRRAREYEATYARLLPKYLAAEFDGLIAELSRPETRRQLGSLGVAPSGIDALRLQGSSELPAARRLSLLRQAGRFILPFMPSGGDSHVLGLGDKLRFYAANSPRGRYLGLYEVRGPSWLTGRADEPLPASGRLLVIIKEPGGRMIVEDRRPDRRRRYLLTPVPHPAGLQLYRIAVRA